MIKTVEDAKQELVEIILNLNDEDFKDFYSYYKSYQWEVNFHYVDVDLVKSNNCVL